MFQVSLEIDVSQIKELLTQVHKVHDFRVSALTTAARYSTVTVRDRISRGKLASGQMMVSKSLKKEGRYSKQWGKIRKKKGLKVDIVTLSFSGYTLQRFKVLNDFQAFKNDQVIVGLETDEADKIASYNNDMFGNAYDYSESEIDAAFKDYLELFDTELTNI